MTTKAEQIQAAIKTFSQTIEDKFSVVKRKSSRYNKCWQYIDEMTGNEVREILPEFSVENMVCVLRACHNKFLNLSVTASLQGR